MKSPLTTPIVKRPGAILKKLHLQRNFKRLFLKTQIIKGGTI